MKPEITPLLVKPAIERSTAEGNLYFQKSDLVADIQVQLGPAWDEPVELGLRVNAQKPSLCRWG